jgi:hypothetical protein
MSMVAMEQRIFTYKLVEGSSDKVDRTIFLKTEVFVV